MNAEVKAMWVAALRSGEYEQGTAIGVMHMSIDDTVEYDPLGVLCQLAVKAGLPITVEKKESTTEMAVYDTYYDGEHKYLPKSVMDWAGIEQISPQLQMTDGVFDITYINDFGDYTSFEVFADLIAAQF